MEPSDHVFNMVRIADKTGDVLWVNKEVIAFARLYQNRIWIFSPGSEHTIMSRDFNTEEEAKRCFESMFAYSTEFVAERGK